MRLLFYAASASASKVPESDIDKEKRKHAPLRVESQPHPTGAVIPSGGVAAAVEESRLRDPSTHFVRSG